MNAPIDRSQGTSPAPARGAGFATPHAGDAACRWCRTALAAVTAALLAVGTAVAATPLPMLFGAPASAPAGQAAVSAAFPAAPATAALPRTVARERGVAVDFRYLDPQSGIAPAELGVELFDGEVLTLDRAVIDVRGARNYTWHGRVRGYEHSDALLTVVDGKIVGSIDVVDAALRTTRAYQLVTTPAGTQVLRLIDPAGFPPEHPPGADALVAPRPGAAMAGASGMDPAASTSSGAAGVAVTAADAGDTVDVMVVYSNQTAAAASGTIAAEIQYAVDRANLAYANSGVGTRLRLVHFRQVNYNESGDFGTDLSRLRSGADGYMDEVPTLRTTYGADLVSLFIENGTYCGIGYLGPSADYGYTVVNRGCSGGYLSFAHELGHNMGARHDVYVDTATSPYAYGHGYTYPAGRWRTVMAYNDACAAAGVSCTRIPYFSNPGNVYGSPAVAMGTAATSDNTRALNTSAYTVANFRQASGGTVCTYALAPTSASFTAGGGAGSTSLTTAAGCGWTASSSAAWLTVTSIASGTGSATISYAVAANTGAARSASLTAGGVSLAVTQSAPPIARLSATSLSFGNQRVGTTSGAKSATLSNSGGGDLTITGLTQSGTHAADFTRGGTCTVGTALAAGTTCTLQYRFKPAAKGSRTAALAVVTNGGSLSLALSGTGK